ncbi:TrpB-like pyridoxal phosphate-dependent enzyme [Intestinibacillus sp. Marseille-P6563]|uniref:TrpB-like pyridoxal phosphate-dependent enzyme n=1 Tax=Intestinibacillus sp. Marseille-P6563 TaxID=2364792 RepID=UPI000F065659|nr:TrpB-like pyridoxal phosphate-dependent enzyme [Intestinibacillus sp. Marseille-P6563]
MPKIPHRLYLTEDQMPRQWYNLRADMPEQPDPMLNPATGKPVTEEELYPIFCKELAHQELDGETRYVDIPADILEEYMIYRPSPLIRAYNLEKALDTPAKIYYKFEGNNTSGSHKLNSAIAQAYYAKQQGIQRLTTETGAGQWGTALAEACAYYGLELDVFQVKCSYEQKPFRKAIMQVFDANVVPSPSMTTEIGRQILAKDPNTTGSLGCAISEAVEKATHTDSCRYVLGSVLNQVLLHQSIIGLEAKTAMEILDEYPDIVIGCAGGGSNLGGLIAPFMQDKLTGKADPRIIAVEPASCPSLTRGRYAYDYCDTGKVTPMARMYTLGAGFVPSANHAGGLRYHGMSPILSKLYHDGYMEATSVKQTEVFEAAVYFAKKETILPAPESAHAIRAAMDEAIRCRESGEAKTILFGLTGTGYFDMTAYSAYREGIMQDYIPTDEDLERGFASLPTIPGIQE